MIIRSKLLKFSILPMTSASVFYLNSKNQVSDGRAHRNKPGRCSDAEFVIKGKNDIKSRSNYSSIALYAAVICSFYQPVRLYMPIIGLSAGIFKDINKCLKIAIWINCSITIMAFNYSKYDFFVFVFKFRLLYNLIK